MGSFLVKCGLTNNSIRPNEKVKIIPIAFKKDSSAITYIDASTGEEKSYLAQETVCYPADAYPFLGFVFDAKSTDYGQYELDVEDVSNNFMLLEFKKYLEKSALKVLPNNRDDGFDINDEKYNDLNIFIKDVLRSAFLNRFLIQNKHWYDDPTTLHFYVVKADAYQLLLNFHKNVAVKELEYSTKHNFTHSIESNTIQLKSMSEKFELFYNYSCNAKEMFVHKHTFQEQFEFEQNILPYLLKIERYSNCYAFRPHQLRTIILKNKISKEVAAAVFETYCNLGYFLNSLDLVNCTPKPVEPAHQDYSNDWGLSFAALIQVVANKFKKDYLDYQEEEGDLDEDETLETYFTDYTGMFYD